MTMIQKRMMRLAAAFGAFALLGSCGPRDAATDDAGSIVLYSSQDDYVLTEAVAAFTAETGIEVRVVGDSEATKTTGLVNRLLSEHEQGRSGEGRGKAGGADVWWSNEPFGTIRLSEAGVLTPCTSETAERAFEGGWPGALVGEKGDWYGHALRARVLVWSADRVRTPPSTMEELTGPSWKGRVGMARPEFGTTRGHMAALLEALGPDGFEAWLTGLKANGVRVYDANSSVVRAVWMGEIDAGLTDTDDALVGQGRGWAIEMAQPTDAPLVVPSTVGLVAGGAGAGLGGAGAGGEASVVGAPSAPAAAGGQRAIARVSASGVLLGFQTAGADPRGAGGGSGSAGGGDKAL